MTKTSGHKFNISWEQQKLLRWNKKHFHHFQRVSIELHKTFLLEDESLTFVKTFAVINGIKNISLVEKNEALNYNYNEDSLNDHN